MLKAAFHDGLRSVGRGGRLGQNSEKTKPQQLDRLGGGESYWGLEPKGGPSDVFKSYHQAAGVQLPLFDAATEAECYHSTEAHGFFAVLVDRGIKKCQSSHKLSEMPRVLNMLDHFRDTWISQAEFIRPNRQVVNLARVGLLFADLDTYNVPALAGRTPEQLASAVLYHCADEGIPTPSLLVFSGRGIQAKWFLDRALPRQALIRWNACQRHLIERLTVIGADRKAKDAARVLRLVSTVNTKSGEICRVVHVENGSDGQPIRYGFEYLAEMLLPVARWDVEANRKKKRETRREARLVLVEDTGRDVSGLNRFSGRHLAWDRLEDLRRLADLRGGVHEGERMLHLHWRLNFLLLSGATNSGRMYHEAAALARELDAGWGYRSAELMTLYAKAKQLEAGEKVEFAGRQYPPLYTPRNSTLIDLFGITDDEQRQLQTIISRSITNERHAQRERERRKAAGAVDRATHLAAVADKRADKQAEARLLRAQGLSVRAIAAQMGVSVGAVSGYLKA